MAACKIEDILKEFPELAVGSSIKKILKYGVETGDNFSKIREQYVFAADGVLGQEKTSKDISPSELNENQLRDALDNTALKTADSENQIWANEDEMKNRKSTDKYTLHSGGANGADSVFGSIASSLGMLINHYFIKQKKYDTYKTKENGKYIDKSIKPPKANKPLTKTEFYEAHIAASKASQEMGRSDGNNKTRNKLILRNWNQVKYADVVYAIAEKIINTNDKLPYDKKAKINQVSGGTGYAVQMAVDEGKPVYVYNMADKNWYSAKKEENGKNTIFTKMNAQPKFESKNFAGIGTRKAEGNKEIETVITNLLSQASVSKHKEQDTINEIKTLGAKANIDNRIVNKGRKDKKIIYIGGVDSSTSKYAIERGLNEYENYSNPFVDSSVDEKYIKDNQIQLPKTDKAGSVVAYYNWLKTGIPPAIKKYSKDELELLNTRHKFITDESRIKALANANQVESTTRTAKGGEYGISYEMALLSYAMDETGIVPKNTINKDGKSINIKFDETIDMTYMNDLLNSNNEFMNSEGKNSDDKFVTIPKNKMSLTSDKSLSKFEITKEISKLASDIYKNKNTDYFIGYTGSILEKMSIKEAADKLSNLIFLPNVKFSKEFEPVMKEKYNKTLKDKKDKEKAKPTIVKKDNKLDVGRKINFTYNKFDYKNGVILGYFNKKEWLNKQKFYKEKSKKEKIAYDKKLLEDMIQAAYNTNKTIKKELDSVTGSVDYKASKSKWINEIISNKMNSIKNNKTKKNKETSTVETNKIVKDANTNHDVYIGKIHPEDNVIFVYGANTEARHGMGAAKIAKNSFGALHGVNDEETINDKYDGSSLDKIVGNSYGIPTKDISDKNNHKKVSEKEIIASISDMYKTASNNPDKKFMIAYKDDGPLLSGYTIEEVANMFASAGKIPSNVIFEEDFNTMVFGTEPKGAIFEEDTVKTDTKTENNNKSTKNSNSNIDTENDILNKNNINTRKKTDVLIEKLQKDC